MLWWVIVFWFVFGVSGVFLVGFVDVGGFWWVLVGCGGFWWLRGGAETLATKVSDGS
jgi:hypothetical protein